MFAAGRTVNMSYHLNLIVDLGTEGLVQSLFEYFRRVFFHVGSQHEKDPNIFQTNLVNLE